MSRRSHFAQVDGIPSKGRGKRKWHSVACYPCSDCQNIREFKRSHVCFGCRVSVRRSHINRWRQNRYHRWAGSAPPKCPHCGGGMVELSPKMRIPKKSDDREWKAFEKLVRAWK